MNHDNHPPIETSAPIDIPTPTDILTIARRAGAVILQEYNKTVPAEINWKADDSPLTLADQRSHKLIEAELAALTPDIPLLSEEGMQTPYEQRRTWPRFWCVDPMDGTKEFIKKSGQFTVNIALIEGQTPILGVIYVPALGIAYFAQRRKGSFRVDGLATSARDGEHGDAGNNEELGGAGLVGRTGNLGGTGDAENKEGGLDQPSFGVEPIRPKPIQCRPLDLKHIAIVASKDHAGPAVKALIDAHPQAQTRSMGSSLKFCMVAEGEADLYYRDVPTFEWDTAAAHIIVEEGGGSLTKATGEPLLYNKENLRNPAILTSGDRHEDWVQKIS
ncbi:MAG: 3'(2'),5'-bisphosphate nucleotidase CysQ family protein [Balneolaceae bacterium]